MTVPSSSRAPFRATFGSPKTAASRGRSFSGRNPPRGSSALRVRSAATACRTWPSVPIPRAGGSIATRACWRTSPATVAPTSSASVRPAFGRHSVTATGRSSLHESCSRTSDRRPAAGALTPTLASLPTFAASAGRTSSALGMPACTSHSQTATARSALFVSSSTTSGWKPAAGGSTGTRASSPT